jgi:DNA-binding GntR family transcriptional regulator
MTRPEAVADSSRGAAHALARTRAVATGNGRPLYLAVDGALRAELHGGRWAVGSSLPSEAELSDRFGVSRITVRHALRLLEADGYIRKAPARRPLVVATNPGPRPGWTVESLDDIVALAGDAQLRVQSWRKEQAPAEASLFGLPAGAGVPCLRSLLVRQGRAYASSLTYFPPAIGEQLARRNFDDAVVFRVLQRELGIAFDDVRLTVGAETATVEDAASLPCEPGSALLVMQLLYRETGGRLVEVAHSRSLASVVRLSTRLTTGPRHP